MKVSRNEVKDDCHAIAETAYLLRNSAGARRLVEAMELQLRLPRIWTRIVAGELAPWRGRIIAHATMDLSPARALDVDRRVLWCAERGEA